MFALAFKASVDSLTFVLCHLCALDSEDHLWCDTCSSLGSQYGNRAVSIHALAYKRWWARVPGPGCFLASVMSLQGWKRCGIWNDNVELRAGDV